MRIVSGTCRGRSIHPPRNFRARPTTDFAKENLFNVIAHHFNLDEVRVLDLFSGTGSISYEFASRGARQVLSVEMDPVHQRFIRQTAGELGLDRIRSVRQNAFTFLKTVSGQSYDIVFADPPYDLEGIDALPDLVLEKGLVAPGGWFVFEHSKGKDFSSHPAFLQHRSYGSVNFSIFGVPGK